MKNIHILPTDKPSKLHLWTDDKGSKLELCDLEYSHTRNTQNIYITSDEYIGLSYYLDGNLIRKGVVDDKDYWEVRKDYKKIILTTDQDLIKDGVQAIEDEFLEWFVKNPSCEEVEVKPLMAGFVDDEPSYYENMYEIIIPKEETLEEALTAEEFFRNKIKENIEWEGEITLWKVPLNAELSMRWAKEYSDYVIKWQQEQMYSEEEVLDILREHTAEIFKGSKLTLTEWFEQFKNK